MALPINKFKMAVFNESPWRIQHVHLISCVNRFPRVSVIIGFIVVLIVILLFFSFIPTDLRVPARLEVTKYICTFLPFLQYHSFFFIITLRVVIQIRDNKTILFFIEFFNLERFLLPNGFLPLRIKFTYFSHPIGRQFIAEYYSGWNKNLIFRIVS